MLKRSGRRDYASGPGGPPGATAAAALTDVQAAIKAVLTAIDLPTARTALGLGSVANLAPADLPVSTAAAAALATLATQVAANQATLAAILGGAPAALDTFVEAYNRFLADESAAAAMLASITALQTALTAEVTRAQAAEQTNATAIGNNATAIANEVTRATTAEGQLAPKARQIGTAAGSGLSGGGDLSADRNLSIAANGVTNAMLAQMAAGTLKANLLGSTANGTDATFTQILDAIYGAGAARGAILVRGASAWGGLALGATGQTLQSNGTDLVFAAAAPGTGALRYDAGQSLSAGQQDQVRANVLGAVLASFATNQPLTVLDHDRPLSPTAAVTITAANALGWRSGPICNTTALSALVTLAVPTGATLDGVTNGTTTLYPLQRARIVQTGATAYVTEWIERAVLLPPIAASGVAAADVSLPVGYTKFRCSVSGLVMSSSGAAFGIRFGDAGGVKAGAADYNTQRAQVAGGVAASPSDQASYGIIANAADPTNTTKPLATFTVFPGASGQYPSAVGHVSRRDSSSTSIVEAFGIAYRGDTTGAMGRANLMRFIATAGTFSGNITVWLEP